MASFVQSPKLMRPRSLSIQRPEEEELANGRENNEDGVKSDPAPIDEPDETILAKGVVEDLINSNAPDEGAEQQGGDAGRKTPSNLTSQGYVDLKFYHSRLW